MASSVTTPNASGSSSSSGLNIFAFWKAQMPAWKITVIRTSLERLAYKLVLPYLTLYIVLMGASETQIGFVTSAGLVAAALLGPILGQQIDMHGPKKMYIIGILILAGGYLAFWGAPVWQVAALGLFLHQMGSTLGGQSCSNICGNCLANCDRAKGMLVCETLAAGVLGMIGPAFSGWFLVNVMKVSGTPTNANQIRPLFFFTVLLTVISLVIVVFKLDVRGMGSGVPKEKRNAFKDAWAMMRADKNCLKWVITVGVARMPIAMIVPFLQLYAAEVKGASAGQLAAMTTATALTSVVCGYLFGILSDKFGRKVTLTSTILLYIAGLLLLIFSNNTSTLIVVGMLAGFQEIGQVLAGSVQHELVPAWARGRWAGANNMIGSLISAAMAAIAGYVYDVMNPSLLFIIYIAAEIFVRLPILFSLPETLHYTVNEEHFAALKD